MGCSFSSNVIANYEDRRKAEDLIDEFVKVVRSSHDKDLRECLADLRAWHPEYTPVEVLTDWKACGGDANDIPPFFTEAYLYPLLGKNDARTILALMRPVWELIGAGDLH